MRKRGFLQRYPAAVTVVLVCQMASYAAQGAEKDRRTVYVAKSFYASPHSKFLKRKGVSGRLAARLIRSPDLVPPNVRQAMVYFLDTELKRRNAYSKPGRTSYQLLQAMFAGLLASSPDSEISKAAKDIARQLIILRKYGVMTGVRGYTDQTPNMSVGKDTTVSTLETILTRHTNMHSIVKSMVVDALALMRAVENLGLVSTSSSSP